MTTAVQHRRGTTAEHSTFTGLEGEVTIDTTKDTAVIHDGSLAGGYPLAKETLANVNPSTLSAITGAATASDDLFLMYDTSALSMKKISRAELNNAITIEALDTVDINGGTIDGTTIGGTTAAAGAFTTLSASGNVTLSGGTANGVAYLNGSKVLTSGSALTFDGANLGLGVTPSAWSLTGVLQFNKASLYSASDSQFSAQANTYYDGSFKYIANNFATQYQQTSGTHRWLTAPSGTAGNAISFTEKARIDSDGLKFNGDTAAANALDDYEQGTWTPVIEGSTSAGSYTYTNGYGYYTKIGQQVTVTFNLTNITQVSAGTGYMQIKGLPFAKSSGVTYNGSLRLTSAILSVGTTWCTLEFISGSTSSTLYVLQMGSGSAGVDFPVSSISSGATDVTGTITYIV